MAFPPFGRVRARSDSPPRPVAFLCRPTGQPWRQSAAPFAPPLQGHLTRLETMPPTGSERSRPADSLPQPWRQSAATVRRPTWRRVRRDSVRAVCRQVRAKRAATARRGVPAVRTGSRPSRFTAAPCAVPVRRGDGHGFGQSPPPCRRRRQVRQPSRRSDSLPTVTGSGGATVRRGNRGDSLPQPFAVATVATVCRNRSPSDRATGSP